MNAELTLEPSDETIEENLQNYAHWLRELIIEIEPEYEQQVPLLLPLPSS